MSYEDAIAKLRQQSVDAPTFTDVEVRRRWVADNAVLGLRRGKVLACASAALVGYLVLSVRPVISSMLDPRFVSHFGEVAAWFRLGVATLLPAALIAWSMTLLRKPRVGPQMLMRAVWWSNIVVGTLIALTFSESVDRFVGAGIACACAAAILFVGQRGLEEPAHDDPFRPARFRGHLLLALVMAFADAQTLLFSGVMQARVGLEGWSLLAAARTALPTMLAAAVMCLAVWGLYRLRTWALFLNIVANFVIAFLALDGRLGVALPVAAALAMTATVQLFLPVPILALALGEKRAGRPLLASQAHRLLPVSVVVLASLAALGSVGPGFARGWLTGPGRAFQRGLRPRAKSFDGANLARETFSGQRLTRATFLDANARLASFTKARLGGARFDRANLEFARFDEAGLVGASLVDVNLSYGSLVGARLRKADLTNATLTDASLMESDLRQATFEGADLRRADLTGALVDDLSGVARWEGATCPDGAAADPELGCQRHDGTIAGDSELARRVQGRFVVADDSNWSCELVSGESIAVVSVHLHFWGGSYVSMGDGVFKKHVNVVRSLTYSWDEADEPSILLESRGCGTLLWRRTP